MFELQTVTFGDKSSPTAATVALHHVATENASDDEVHRVIANQFYVDDLNDSVRSSQNALELKESLRTTLAKGNFNIRKWLSNRKEICDTEFYPEDGNTVALGTEWNLEKDTLRVKDVNLEDCIPTKRNILKMTATYYDIFGMLSGLLVRPKILLQKLWMHGYDWDTPIDPDSDLKSSVEAATRDLKEAKTVCIDRCLIPEKYRGKQPLPRTSLHGFSDASEDAMAMAVWLRWSEDDSKDAELSFVCAKSRVTPLKQTSMPRKELQALLLLSRLMLTVQNALRLEISDRKMWTDSMTAISWLRGQSKTFRSYVAYHVGEITAEFDPNCEIAYVPSEQNTIDLATRGVDASGMQQVIQGPTFLRKPPSYWPVCPRIVPDDQSDIEKKRLHVKNTKVLTVRISNSEPILDPTRFSSWPRLVMVTARILSLKDLPKNQWLKQLKTKIVEWPSRERIKEAELYWIRHAQASVNLEDNHVVKLHPFMDEREHVLRVGGRLHNAPLNYDVRHPYLLPRKSHISLLIVRDRHRHALHCGQLRTAAEVRKNFWIIGDVNLARRVIRECTTCRRHRGKTLQQKMGNLPSFRVKPFTPPFHTTIVDYLGPVQVKLSRNTTSKGYCAVFVCTVTRAAHLTCVQDLTTSAFLQALERFVSIRGAPSLIISDNATCFRGADNEIRDLQVRLDQDVLRSKTSMRYDTEWKFGPPSGPHHQGLVERMVQEVKKSMKHMVHAEKLTFMEWETVFSQISALINSRPLTASSSSPFDDPAITPNHFLIGRGDLPSPRVPCEENTNLYKRRQLCNRMVDEFWRRWMMNIHKLSPRSKWNKETACLAVGDVVLVFDESLPSGCWKMAEVVNVYSGGDNLVRVVDIKFADGHILKRPITKLVLLMKYNERLDFPKD